MSNPVSNAEIEDVLSSIRRLVSENAGAIKRGPAAEDSPEKLVLTPAFRIDEADAAEDVADIPEAGWIEDDGTQAREGGEVVALDGEAWARDHDGDDGAADDFRAASGAEDHGAAEDAGPEQAEAAREVEAFEGEYRVEDETQDEALEQSPEAGTDAPQDGVDDAGAQSEAQHETQHEAHDGERHGGEEDREHGSDLSAETAGDGGVASLESRLAELEAAIDRSGAEWEPDGSEDLGGSKDVIFQHKAPQSVPPQGGRDDNAGPAGEASDGASDAASDAVLAAVAGVVVQAQDDAEDQTHSEVDVDHGQMPEAAEILIDVVDATAGEDDPAEATDIADAHAPESVAVEPEAETVSELVEAAMQDARAAEVEDASDDEASHGEADEGAIAADVAGHGQDDDLGDGADAEAHGGDHAWAQGEPSDGSDGSEGASVAPDEAQEWEDLDAQDDAALHIADDVDTDDLGDYAEDAGYAADGDADFADDEADVIDEDMLRDMVARIVREELQGSVGERITQNVRRMVRREIARALALQDFE